MAKYGCSLVFPVYVWMLVGLVILIISHFSDQTISSLVLQISLIRLSVPWYYNFEGELNMLPHRCSGKFQVVR